MTRDGAVVEALIGEFAVLFIPGRRKLLLLNQSASICWRACRSAASGTEAASIAAALEEYFGLDAAVALAEAASLLTSWRRAGVTGSVATGEKSLDEEAWVIPAPHPRPLNDHQVAFEIAGLPFALEMKEGPLRNAICSTLAGHRPLSAQHYTHLLAVEGDPQCFSLSLNCRPHVIGSSSALDDAASLALGLLTDLVTQSEERLLVIHGAGLALENGFTLLLIAPSGHGKTTLAAALNAQGLALLSDDVVPIARSGSPVSLGLPMCIKSGSWDVLRSIRPDIDDFPVMRRHGKHVRFVPPLPNRSPKASLRPGLLLFPKYESGATTSLKAVPPERALQLIIESESIIRNIDHEKLQDLMLWITSIASYELTYPDLETAVDLVSRTLVKADGRET